MPRSRVREWTRLCSWPLAALALASLLPQPSAANVLPESALIVHVQPVTGSCATAITNCEDVVDAAPSLGQWEFLLFFQPIYWQQGHEPVTIGHLHSELVWPDSWDLLESEICSGEGELAASAPPYVLEVDWWNCPSLPIDFHAMFLIARLTFSVHEPGRFGFGNWMSSAVEVGCPGTPFLTYPVGCYAEVAQPCEFTHSICGYFPQCGIGFTTEEMILSAPPGGSASGETELWVELCTLTALETLADWLSVEATEIGPYHYRLLVTADASELGVGTYSSWIRASGHYQGRCLPVEFRVADLTPASVLSWGRIKALY